MDCPLAPEITRAVQSMESWKLEKAGAPRPQLAASQLLSQLHSCPGLPVRLGHPEFFPYLSLDQASGIEPSTGLYYVLARLDWQLPVTVFKLTTVTTVQRS